MTAKSDDPFRRVVTQEINRMLSAQIDTSRSATSKSSVCPSDLAAALDRAFANPDEIESLANLIQDRLVAICPHTETAHFDSDCLESIATDGFEATLAHSTHRGRLAPLLLRMTVDDRLLRDALGAVFGGEIVSEFWEARIFRPSVRVLAIPEGIHADQRIRDTSGEEIDYEFSISNSTFVAVLSNLDMFAGRRALYALRFQDDPKISIFRRDPAKSNGELVDSRARLWAQYFECAKQGQFRSGEGVVDDSGSLTCRIEDRPYHEELMASTLVVGLFKLTK